MSRLSKRCAGQLGAHDWHRMRLSVHITLSSSSFKLTFDVVGAAASLDRLGVSGQRDPAQARESVPRAMQHEKGATHNMHPMSPQPPLIVWESEANASWCMQERKSPRRRHGNSTYHYQYLFCHDVAPENLYLF